MPNRAEILKQQFMQSLGLPWQTLLTESRLEEILKEENVSYRKSVYTPIVTMWAMVSQVLDPDKSLSNAKPVNGYQKVYCNAWCRRLPSL